MYPRYGTGDPIPNARAAATNAQNEKSAAFRAALSARGLDSHGAMANPMGSRHQRVTTERVLGCI